MLLSQSVGLLAGDKDELDVAALSMGWKTALID